MAVDCFGKVNSIQTLGAVDGPGVRFTIFLQGCLLRCACCHNPDTWEIGQGQDFTANEIVEKAKRYKEYFGDKGGITLSGGEPLLQAEFAAKVFKLCKESGINTCLDTSGSVLSDEVVELLKYTDLCMLDIKYTDDKMYKQYVGCSISKPLQFLKVLNERKIPTWIRYVVIPKLNDRQENILKLAEIVKQNECITKTEFLPFKKLCVSKYDNLKIKFPLKDYPEPSNEEINKIEKLFKSIM